MTSVPVTSKGQMTLPKAVRDDLAVKPGDRVELTKYGDGYLLTRKKSAIEVFARFRRTSRKPLSAEEMNEAIEAEVWESNRPQHARR